MKTTLKFLDLNIHNSWYRLLDQHLDYWQRQATVTAAEVIMERQPQDRPTFRVQVRLEVAGDILQAESTAQTLKAALLLASHELETQFQARKAHRIARRARHHHPESVPVGEIIVPPRASDAGTPGCPSFLPLLPRHKGGLT